MDEEEDDIEIVMEEAPVDNYQKPITVISTGKGDESGMAELEGGHSTSLPGAEMSSGEGRVQDAGRSTITKTMAISGHLDMNAILYEGKSIFNVDLDSFDDKPWRKPGVDMTDYFNYGFDENLWRLYCQKQKSLRDDNLLHRKINVYEGVSVPVVRPSSVQAPRYGFESNASYASNILPAMGSNAPIPTYTSNQFPSSGPGKPPLPHGLPGGHPFPPQGSLQRPPMPPPPSILQQHGGQRMMPPPPPPFGHLLPPQPSDYGQPPVHPGQGPQPHGQAPTQGLPPNAYRPPPPPYPSQYRQ